MLHFLVPVLNEETNIEKVLSNIAERAKETGESYRLFVVDDGSTDSTPAVLSNLKTKHPLIAIRHEKNRGPGAAFETGFETILKNASPDDFVITMDGDATHSPRTIQLIVGTLREGYEVAIASVFCPGGMMIGVPFLRYCLTIGCNLLYRILFPVRGVREYTGFFRGFRVSALLEAREKFGGTLISVAGFGGMAELLVRLRQVPVFMKEVPMIIRFNQRKGSSKMRIARTIGEHLNIIGANLFRRRVI